MRRHWLLAFVAIVIAAAFLSLLSTLSSARSVEALPGYCAYVTPPPGVPWGGATVCTPWG